MATKTIPLLNDTFLHGTNTNMNYSTSDIIYIGESNAASARFYRSLIQPDFSTIPAGAVFSSAILGLTPVQDLTSNASTVYAYRCLRNIVYNETTWNIWKTGNNWDTAGCANNSTDYDGANVLGSFAVSADPTLNTPIEMTLDAAEFQKLYDGTYSNYGIVLLTSLETTNNGVGYASIEHATPGYRPYITIEYEAPLSTGQMVVDISGYGIF